MSFKTKLNANLRARLELMIIVPSWPLIGSNFHSCWPVLLILLTEVLDSEWIAVYWVDNRPRQQWKREWKRINKKHWEWKVKLKVMSTTMLNAVHNWTKQNGQQCKIISAIIEKKYIYIYQFIIAIILITIIFTPRQRQVTYWQVNLVWHVTETNLYTMKIVKQQKSKCHSFIIFSLNFILFWNHGEYCFHPFLSSTIQRDI